MHWADDLADQILKSGKHKPYWVDDMKTPSGRVHIGSVRAVVTHELIYRVLKDRGVDVAFSYVLEDHDPMDGLPVYVDQKKFSMHLGKPLFQVPSPEKGYASFGERWGKEYEEIFNAMGVHPQVIWGSKLYLSGKMNDMVKLCLDEADKIRSMYKTLYGEKKPADWFPFFAVCEQCGKLSTTAVTAWDGDKITYECNVDGLEWTKGCGHKGKVSPFSTKNHYAGKLPWKVEWPCKWKVIGVTIEGAGKDHMSAGGSHDFGKLMCKNVIKYPVPFHFSHEFFLVGGHKMSSSRGLGSSAKEVAELIPPFLIRLMIARVKYNRAIDFDPGGMTIPDLFDAYDEAALSFWGKKDKKLARLFELSQVEGAPPSRHFLPRFRDVATFIQYPEIDIYNRFEDVKGKPLTDFERDVIEDRVKYAQLWLDGYAPTEAVFKPSEKIPDEALQLSHEQKAYLGHVVTLLGKEWKEPDDLQQALYNQAKEMGLSTQKAFAAIYLSLTGKDHGPRAAWFLLEHASKAVKRFKEIQKAKATTAKITYRYPTITDTSFLKMSDDIKQAYPSMKIAMAKFKAVDNATYPRTLTGFRDGFLKSIRSTTQAQINQSPKINAYRQAIRGSGIDWHSRRPTMEALLRRVAQGKEIVWINPLVDIGNIIAMKHFMSDGMFDLDKLSPPLTMKKSAGGEKILMIGDKEAITLKKGEICYFDQKGPFIVDLCWRDAQRTEGSATTKNVLFLSEAVYDITRTDLEEALADTIQMVETYTGGKLQEAGIITAS